METTFQAAILSCAAGLAAAQRRLPQRRKLGEEIDLTDEGDEASRNLKAEENAEVDESSVDDLVTTNMPGLTDKIELVHHAGRISLGGSKRNNIFYWHFAAAESAETAPLVIWLNGGPGCSSMQGLFLGVSPFQIEDEAKISINKHSWHHTANVLFIDQPVGTGMSYTRGNDYRTDELSVAKDFYEVLTKFFQRHPEYVTTAQGSNQAKSTRELYIFGESHAGRFIPEFSDYIVAQNKLATTTSDLNIRLTGIGIGNGWVHPYIQYDYSEFAHGLGLVTFGQVRALKSDYVDCQNALLSGNYLSPSCFKNMNSILDGLKNSHAPGSKALNFYDVRHYVHSVGAYPAQRADIREYMNQMEVRQMLHANTDPGFRFRDCSDEVYDGLRSFDGVSTLHVVERLLKGGMRVLFYNGQWDMMCNHYSTEKLLLHLNWNGSAAYQEATKFTWSVDGRKDPAGFAQQGGNLTYTVIAGAGHMVPMDVPDVAAEMMKRFVRNLPFDDSAQSVKSLKTNSTTLEAAHCPVQASGFVGNSVNLTWLWVCVVVAVVGSLLVFCVSIMCRRTRKARHSEHSVIIQESDDEDVDQEKGQDNEQEADSDEELTEVSIRSRG